MSFSAFCNRLAHKGRRIFDAEVRDIHIAVVGDPRFQFATRLDVVESNSPKRPPKQFRREVAAARRHRTDGKRCSEQADGRIEMVR